MYYEVGYDVGDGIYSVNLIDGGDVIAKMTAEEHAQKHGYRIAYLTKISDAEAEEHKRRGMPVVDAFDYLFSKSSKN